MLYEVITKEGKDACHTFLDDIVGAIAAAASTRVAQVENENAAKDDPSIIEKPKLRNNFV